MFSDDRGSGTVTSFIVALAVFVVGFSSITMFLTDYVGKGSGTAGVNLDATNKASNGLDLLVGSPGIPAAWERDDWGANASLLPKSLGLLKANTKNTIDINKLRRLQGFLPGYGAVDDATLAGGVGLPDYNLHLRTYPLYSLNGDGTVAWPTGYPVAYVGDYDEAPVTDAFSGSAEMEIDSLARIHLGFVPALAQPSHVMEGAGSFSAGDAMNDSIHFLKVQLIPRLVGFDYAYDADASILSGMSVPVDTGTDVLVNNTYWKVINTSLYPGSFGGAEHVLTPSRYSAHNGAAAAWRYSYPDDSSLVTPAIKVPTGMTGLTLRLNQSVLGVQRSATGNNTTIDDFASVWAICVSNCGTMPVNTWVPVANWTVNGAASPGDFKLNDTSIAGYGGKTIRLGFRWKTGVYLSTPCNLLPLGLPPCTPLNARPSQGWFIRDIQLFGTQSGARKDLWTNTFNYSQATSNYGVIVFGTGVDQSTFANDGLAAPEVSTIFKTALREWVERGGRILLLGSGSMRNDWLAPYATQDTARDNVNGQPDYVRSDITHTLLTVPFMLDQNVYMSTDRHASYHYTPKGNGAFTDILYVGGEPVLSITAPAAGLNGSVILTSLMPGAFSEAERDHFFQNMISFLRFRHIYLDQGASILDQGSAVGSASRNVLTETGDPEMGSVEMRIVLYAWS